jgi:hypothetical protein
MGIHHAQGRSLLSSWRPISQICNRGSAVFLSFIVSVRCTFNRFTILFQILQFGIVIEAWFELPSEFEYRMSGLSLKERKLCFFLPSCLSDSPVTITNYSFWRTRCPSKGNTIEQALLPSSRQFLSSRITLARWRSFM